jgi:hypothetical protein
MRLSRTLRPRRTDVAAARLCSAFEAGGDIDAITKDIVAFDQHVAKVDWTPIRNCIRRSSGTSTFRFAMSSWSAMAHSMADHAGHHCIASPCAGTLYFAASYDSFPAAKTSFATARRAGRLGSNLSR